MSVGCTCRKRCTAPTTASPLDQTLIEKNEMAVRRLKNEPTMRPTTPKCALDDTALLVPVSGAKIAIGARMMAPVNTPTIVAASPCQNDRPKMMGKAPSTAVASELEPPHSMRMKSKIVAVRSLSGMDSIPCRSISPLPLMEILLPMCFARERTDASGRGLTLQARGSALECRDHIWGTAPQSGAARAPKSFHDDWHSRSAALIPRLLGSPDRLS